MSKIQKDKTGYYMSLEEFDKKPGEVFGGTGYLQLQVGQAAGPFTYVKAKTESVNEEFEDCVVHYATDPNGKEIRMPVQASFQYQAKDAGLKAGVKFAVARWPDQTGKKGRAKGKVLAIYRVKVLARK